MMVNILDLIADRTQYYFSSCEVDPAYMNIPKDSDLAYLITPERDFLKAYSSRPDMIQSYYVSGIFDLGEVYSPYIDCRFSLFQLSSQKTEDVKSSLYMGSIYAEGNRSLQSFQDQDAGIYRLNVRDNYSPEYLYYLDDLEKWLNTDGQISDSFYGTYNVVNRALFDIKQPFSSRYSKQSMEIDDQLSREKLIKLSDIAEVFDASEYTYDHAEGTVFWSTKPYDYKYDPSCFIVNEHRNGLLLQKGDIVLNPVPDLHFYYFHEEFESPVFCPTPGWVIRAREGISAEYIFLYLDNSCGQLIISEYVRGSVIKDLEKSELENLPVIKPARSKESYHELFLRRYNSGDLYNVFSDSYKRQPCDELEQLLTKDVLEGAQRSRNRDVNDIIKEDINELRLCINAGAYKAALILTGSILEAFLTDWLSELENHNYFDSSENIPLYQIINRIKEIKKPDWMTDAENAHEIKNQRNKVHAKLCLKSKEKIDENLCLRVASYLTEIIKTRFPDSSLL